MKLLVISPIIFLISLAIISCSPKQKIHSDEEDLSPSGKLYSEVIDIHDTLMPKIENIMIYKGKAKKKMAELDSLNKGDLKKDLVGQKMQLGLLLKSLTHADDAMMNWMHQFDPNMKNLSEDEKVKYLEEEKIKISKVKITMDSTLKVAGKILD